MECSEQTAKPQINEKNKNNQSGKKPINPFKQFEQKSQCQFELRRQIRQYRNVFKGHSSSEKNNYFASALKSRQKVIDINANQLNVNYSSDLRRQQRTEKKGSQISKYQKSTKCEDQINEQQLLNDIQKQIPLKARSSIANLSRNFEVSKQQSQNVYKQSVLHKTEKGVVLQKVNIDEQSGISKVSQFQREQILYTYFEQSFCSEKKAKEPFVQTINQQKNNEYCLKFEGQQLKCITKKIRTDCFESQFTKLQKYQSCQEIAKHLKPEQVFKTLDRLWMEDYQQVVIFAQSLMNKQISQQQQKTHANILKNAQKQVKSRQEDTIWTVLLVLFLMNSNKKTQILFTQQQTVQSQLTVKALSTGFLMNRVKFVQVLQNDDTQWRFDNLLQQLSIKKFQQWFKNRIRQKTGITDIVIHQIKKCCIQVTWSSSEILKVSNHLADTKTTLHPYFRYFQLSPKDFDQRGNISFPDQPGSAKKIQKRGGYPYYQPIKCKRFGLNVSGKFDDQDIWLTMYGRIGEWPIAFHGVRYPQVYCQTNDLRILNSIMKGMTQDQQIMLRQGYNQGAQDFPAVNRPQPIPKGVYCAPQIQTSLIYSQATKVPQTGKSYRLIFQCRIDPEQLYITQQNHQYWILKQPFIRPYAIILIKQQNVKEVSNSLKVYGQIFSYHKYKKQIDLYLSRLRQQQAKKLN